MELLYALLFSFFSSLAGMIARSQMIFNLTCGLGLLIGLYMVVWSLHEFWLMYQEEKKLTHQMNGRHWAS